MLLQKIYEIAHSSPSSSIGYTLSHFPFPFLFCKGERSSSWGQLLVAPSHSSSLFWVWQYCGNVDLINIFRWCVPLNCVINSFLTAGPAIVIKTTGIISLSALKQLSENLKCALFRFYISFAFIRNWFMQVGKIFFLGPQYLKKRVVFFFRAFVQPELVKFSFVFW